MAVFYNQATLSYTGGTTRSNIVTGELLEVLTVTKTAIQSTYAPGGSVTYVVNLVNAGTNAYTGLTVTDNLGAGSGSTPLSYTVNSLHYYVGGVLQEAPTVCPGPPLSVSGIRVPAGSNATLIYESAVTPQAPLGPTASITNTVVVTGPGLTSPLSAQSTIPMAQSPSLTISKAVCPPTVTENGQLTYTFVIQNSGSTAATAEDRVIITDTFDPILSAVSVTFNGVAWSDPANYSYNAATGDFSTVSGQVTVPAATYSQSGGIWTVTPGVSTLTITGTV